MSDVGSTISQDEIDALLGGVGMGASEVKIDVATLQTFFDGVKDKALNNLNGLSGQSFEISSATVESTGRDQLLAKLAEETVCVYTDFNAGVTGEHAFFIAPEFAAKIASVDEYNDDAGAMIQELMSNITSSEITNIGAKVPGLASDPPNVAKLPKAMTRIPDGSFVLITYTFSLDGESYELYETIAADPANAIASALGGGSKPAPAPAAGGAAPMGGAMPQMGGMSMGQPMMGGMQQPMMGMPMGGGMPMQQPMMGMPGGTPNVQAVQYPSLMGGVPAGEQGNIGLIMDVFMEMTVELGRTKKQIKEILGMGEGTIIELDKLAGEPVDILVNHKPIAKGEVVVIDENFGVRVTEILSPMERVSDMH